MRTGWWRTAGTEDIARVWRAASTWHHVDPRAQLARQMVVDCAVSEDTEQSQRLPMSAEAVSDRHERMAAEVHKAWPGQRADTVIGCEAWGALAYTLDQAQHTGHDVQQLLRGVSRFVDRAQRPAAYACRVVQDQLDDTVDLGTVRMQSRHGTEPAAVAASAFPQSTISAVTEVGSASEEQQPTVRPATSSVSMAAPGR